MSLQTKMTEFDREQRKRLIAEMPNVSLHSFPDAGVTVGIERTGDDMGRFAVALMGKDETKFRRKVGELVVLRRMVCGETQPFRWASGITAEEAAEAIAYAIA